MSDTHNNEAADLVVDIIEEGSIAVAPLVPALKPKKQTPQADVGKL